MVHYKCESPDLQLWKSTTLWKCVLTLQGNKCSHLSLIGEQLWSFWGISFYHSTTHYHGSSTMCIPCICRADPNQHYGGVGPGINENVLTDHTFYMLCSSMLSFPKNSLSSSMSCYSLWIRLVDTVSLKIPFRLSSSLLKQTAFLCTLHSFPSCCFLK